MSSRRFRFFQWNDLHVRNPDVMGRAPGYPRANEKASWLAAAGRGEVDGIEPPDFVASVGDLIHGEIEDHADDFRFLERLVFTGLTAPVLPCVGNHENGQGEGVPERNRAYIRFHGQGWHNYLYIVGGIAFIVVDTSGGHRYADAVTAARTAFVERALEYAADRPIILVTHIPLVPMRREEALAPSFGFTSWRVLDPGLLDVLTRQDARVIAVLGGHLHLTAVRVIEGVYHIAPSGTAGCPADFASFDVFADRIEVRMHRAPAGPIGDPSAGDIHGAGRHGVDYTDVEHTDHESYVSGNPSERCFTIPLGGARRPPLSAKCALEVFHEVAPRQWRQVEAPRPRYPASADRGSGDAH